MFRLMKAIVVTAIISVILSSQIFAQQIRWVSNLGMATERAREQNKILMVFIGISNEDLKEKIEQQKPTDNQFYVEIHTPIEWNNATLINLSEKFVCHMATEGTITKQLYSRMQRAVVFLDPDLKEINIDDFASTQKLLQAMNALPGDASELYSKIKTIDEYPESLDVKLSLADQLQTALSYTISNKYYFELLESSAISRDSLKYDHIRSHIALNYFLMENYPEALPIFQERITNAPTSPERPMQLFLLMRGNLLGKNLNNAKECYEILQKEFPDNQHTQWAKPMIEKASE